MKQMQCYIFSTAPSPVQAGLPWNTGNNEAIKISLNPAVRYAILNMEGAIAHKVVDLPDEVYIINLPRPVKYKAGLFISACYSYLCRQAMQRETNRPKTTGLKLRRYSYASPPLFFKFGEAFHLVTQLLLIL